MKKTNVIILGGGFGGVYAALRLDKTLARRADIEVTLVSRDNFLLFTPMLHEVASGDLNPSDIVNPIRRMLKRVQFVQADVRSIDLAAKRVQCTRDLRRVALDLDFDHLVLALGSETNFFGMHGVAENAVTLKTLGDAALLRARVLAILEATSLEPDPAVRMRMLTSWPAAASPGSRPSGPSTTSFTRRSATTRRSRPRRYVSSSSTPTRLYCPSSANSSTATRSRSWPNAAWRSTRGRR